MNSSNIDTGNSVRCSRVLRCFLLVPVVLACFALSQTPTTESVSLCVRMKS